MITRGEIQKVKGIGEALAKKITELVQTGKLSYYDELKNSIPHGLFDILKIPGLGPKKVKTFYEKLGIKNLGELEYACIENRLVGLEGFGKIMQEKIKDGIRFLQKNLGQHLFAEAEADALAILDEMQKQKHVQEISLAGSLRRRKEIVKDIDIIIGTDHSSQVMEYFTHLPQVEKITAHGETKSVVQLKSGISVDCRTVSLSEFPFALHHSTGSKEHNTALRGRAKSMGILMNEYGLFRNETKIECKDEPSIFSALGLPFIPPELREGMGEIEAAASGTLPKLVQVRDIRGIFHNHTRESDGSGSLREMVEGAQALGYEYIGISDHSRTAFYAHGLEIERIKRQHQEIEALQQKVRGIRIFKGIESDILPDGSLDYPDEVLETFDFVIGSVHSRFNMNESEMTARVLRGMQNPYITILGHPTGRLLLSRNPFPLNMNKILDAANEYGVAIEMNANPHRLDLDWRFGRQVKQKGVQICINPDAHSLEGLKVIPIGVGIARKGWLSKENVLNTRSKTQMERYLNERKKRERV
jgi:DNA polymerase (family 10)